MSSGNETATSAEASITSPSSVQSAQSTHTESKTTTTTSDKGIISPSDQTIHKTVHDAAREGDLRSLVLFLGAASSSYGADTVNFRDKLKVSRLFAYILGYWYIHGAIGG